MSQPEERIINGQLAWRHDDMPDDVFMAKDSNGLPMLIDLDLFED